MAHPLLHSKSSVRKWGGNIEDYIHIHAWFDETKAWLGNSAHRLWRHHSEGIFECEAKFGKSFKNSDGKPCIQDMLLSNMLKKIVIITFQLQRNGYKQ